MQPDKKLEPVTITLSPQTTPPQPRTFNVGIPELTIHPGDELEFHFTGCKNPTIMIPVDGVMDKRIAIPSEKEPNIIRMKVLNTLGTLPKTFAYAVYSPEIDDFAEGNSPPRMVLDPRPRT